MKNSFDNQLFVLPVKDEVKAVLACNDVSNGYGLTLSQKDATDLIQVRKQILKDLDCVELNGGILPKLIEAFADSPFLNQIDYVENLDDLQEIFYRYKTGTDEDMLDLMVAQFNGKCQGSISLLYEFFEKHQRKERNSGKITRDVIEKEVEVVNYCNQVYTPEELVKVVQQVAKLYCNDTSMTYNEARRLMTGVSYSIFCGIRTDKNAIMAEKPEPYDMYKQGQKYINLKYGQIKEKIIMLLSDFREYEVDTIHRDLYERLPKMLSGIDVVRYPNELKLDIEYEPLYIDKNKQGIDKLEEYVNNICREWKFLRHNNQESIINMLQRKYGEYQKQYDKNLCEDVLLQLIGCYITEHNMEKLMIPKQDLWLVELYFKDNNAIEDHILSMSRSINKIIQQLFDETKDIEYFSMTSYKLAEKISDAINNRRLEDLFAVI